MVDGGHARVPTAWCSDGRRSTVALLSGFALPVVAAIVMALTSPPGDDWAATWVVLFLVAWNLYIVIYVVLTMRVFGKVDSVVFAERMAERTARRGRVVRRLQPWGDGPTFTIQTVIVAFVVVLTTLGATDVNVTTPQMRKVVNLHTVLTFVFNSVIVALLVTVLLR